MHQLQLRLTQNLFHGLAMNGLKIEGLEQLHLVQKIV